MFLSSKSIPRSVLDLVTHRLFDKSGEREKVKDNFTLSYINFSVLTDFFLPLFRMTSQSYYICQTNILTIKNSSTTNKKVYVLKRKKNLKTFRQLICRLYTVSNNDGVEKFAKKYLGH